jgi:hypothetical protein
VEIDGVSRLKEDLEIICWQSDHLFFFYIAVLPSILFWVIGIPLSAFFFLSKSKQKLKIYQIKSKFGFIFNGYKSRSFFWEIFIIFRKVLMVMLAVFGKGLGIFIQVPNNHMIMLLGINLPFFDFDLFACVF